MMRFAVRAQQHFLGPFDGARARAHAARVALALTGERALAVAYLGASSLAFAALAIWLARVHGATIVDDAYISLVYARNLANGSGLTYAGGVRVEGYTDVLWVFLAAAAIRLGINGPDAVRLLGFVSALALVGATWWWSQRRSEAQPALRFAPLLLAASGPLAFWSLAGLETATLAALLFAAAAAMAYTSGWRGAALAGLLYLAATLLHPDAALWFAVAAAWQATRRETRSPLRLATLVAIYALPLAVYWIARWWYFGALMPNTFYAKSATSPYQAVQGIRYLGSFIPVVGAFGSALIIAAFVGRLHRRGDMQLLAAQVCVWTVYVVAIGGDTLLDYRFLVPILAPLAILLQESVAWLTGRASNTVPFAAAVALIAVLALGAMGNAALGADAQRIAQEGQMDASRVELGRWFAAHAGQDDVIAVNAAGAIPYFAERPAIDMLGLNDAHIARAGEVAARAPAGHQRFDAAYVLSRRPAFIVLNSMMEGGQDLGPATPALPSITALFQNPDFLADYVRVRIPALSAHEVVYARADRAAQLEATGAVVALDGRFAEDPAVRLDPR